MSRLSTPALTAWTFRVAAWLTIGWLIGWPVLADGLTPLRNHARLVPNLVTTYDTILRNAEVAEQHDRPFVVGPSRPTRELVELARRVAPLPEFECRPKSVLHRSVRIRRRSPPPSSMCVA